MLILDHPIDHILMFRLLQVMEAASIHLEPRQHGLADRTNLPWSHSTDLRLTSSPYQEWRCSYASHSPSSSSASHKPTWRVIHKLEFGAKPERRNRKEWICGLGCKNKDKQVITFKDAQATEKHIMREHPDPIYNKFVCLKDGCGKEKVSPQQILDHLGQKKEKKGHNITAKIDKDENLRAVKKSTGEKFRYVGKKLENRPKDALGSLV